MRNLTTLLFLLSLCSLHLVFSAPASFDFKNQCCQITSNTRIPLKKIMTYWRTSSSCSIQAIVFETVAKKQFCRDPNITWVKDHMKMMDSKKNSNSTSSPEAQN